MLDSSDKAKQQMQREDSDVSLNPSSLQNEAVANFAGADQNYIYNFEELAQQNDVKDN